MYELEPVLTAFEQSFGCRITLHDLSHILFNSDQTPMVMPLRSSHRKTFAKCSQDDREYCINHCFNLIHHRIRRTQRISYLKHCRSRLVEVVAPVYREGNLRLILFAGLWQAPLDRQLIEKLRLVLPVFGEGLISRAESYHCHSGYRIGRKEQIREFLRNRFSEEITTADLAKHLSLSISATCHLVKNLFGSSFSDLLTAERMFHARIYLQDNDYPTAMIAEMCGYRHLEHFYRTFRKYTGTTPREYREMNRL